MAHSMYEKLSDPPMSGVKKLPLTPEVRPGTLALDRALLPEVFCSGLVEEWTSWVQTFELYAQLNGWNDQHKARILGIRLGGKASRVYFDLPLETRNDFGMAIAALTSRFQPRGTQALGMLEFRKRGRRKDETFLDFAVELRRLSKVAFPTMDEVSREAICIAEFIDKMEQRELRLKLRHTSFATLDEAVAFATEWDAIETVDSSICKIVQASTEMTDREKSLEKEVAELRQRLEKLSSNQTGKKKQKSKPKECSFCGKTGHIVEHCYLKTGACFSCGKMGHRIRDCPDKSKQSGKDSQTETLN